jgi:RNA polymerase primary sigma factor
MGGLIVQRERSRDELLSAYLRSVRRIPKLEPDELSHLLGELNRLRRLDDPSWLALKDQVVMHHLRLVIKCARRLSFGSVPVLDLIQEGNLGLMRAADSFDVDRGVLFATYAAWWVRRNILRALEGQGRTVRLPSDAWSLDRRVRRFEGERSVRCGEPPDIEEVAVELQVSHQQVDRVRAGVAGSLSFEHAREGDEAPLGERLPDVTAVAPDKAVAERWAKRVLAAGLSKIDERARQVLVLRWGLGGAPPLTQTEVGRRFGISASCICRIEKTALERMRCCPILRELAGSS